MSDYNFLNGTYSNTAQNASLEITTSTADGSLNGTMTIGSDAFPVRGNWHIVNQDQNIVLSFFGLNPANGQTSQEVGGAGYAKYDATNLYPITLGVYKSSSSTNTATEGVFSPPSK